MRRKSHSLSGPANNNSTFALHNNQPIQVLHFTILESMTTKISFALLGIAISFFSTGQESKCGFKTSCDCDESNQGLKESFEHSHHVFEGTVLEIDTLAISEIVTKEALNSLQNDHSKISACAHNSVRSSKVLRVKFHVNQSFKKQIQSEEIYVLTPIDAQSCAYHGFETDGRYILYTTLDQTADDYFFWSFDKEYLELKPAYTVWTNHCKRTALSKKSELQKLSALSILD